MNIRTLRTVLLIQSIEESDRAGEILPLADRADATREAARSVPPEGISRSGAVLSRSAERFLGERAEALLNRVRARSPVVDHILALAGGLTWFGRTLVGLAFVFGVSLSALDGGRRINILAFPLLGLIAWNLFVYVVVIAVSLRRKPADEGRRFWSGHLYERWVSRRIDSLLRQSSRFNAPLSVGLRQFAGEWIEVAHPLLVERAKRLMHVAAAVVAIGLLAGLYVRGIGLRYEAGWESTFLGPSSVHVLLALIYGPAAAITGIGLPSQTAVEALRWTGSGGGAEAANWIHLIACTAAIYIVLPRLVLAAISAFASWRLSQRVAIPVSLLGYARTLVVGTAGGVAHESASVVSYAYEPGAESTSGLQRLLAATLGGVVKVETIKPIAYGDEDAATPADDWNVLLVNLASTPEAENHGRIVSRLRDALVRKAAALPLLVVVDVGPYALRMKGDASFDQRVQERRELWTRFIAGYGLRACVVDLSRIVAGAPSEEVARNAARESLWPAST